MHDCADAAYARWIASALPAPALPTCDWVRGFSIGVATLNTTSRHRSAGAKTAANFVGIGSAGSPSDINAFDTVVKHHEANFWRQNDRRRIQRRSPQPERPPIHGDRSRGSDVAVRPARNVILVGASHEGSTRPRSYRQSGLAANVARVLSAWAHGDPRRRSRRSAHRNRNASAQRIPRNCAPSARRDHARRLGGAVSVPALSGNTLKGTANEKS